MTDDELRKELEVNNPRKKITGSEHFRRVTYPCDCVDVFIGAVKPILKRCQTHTEYWTFRFSTADKTKWFEAFYECSVCQEKARPVKSDRRQEEWLNRHECNPNAQWVFLARELD